MKEIKKQPYIYQRILLVLTVLDYLLTAQKRKEKRETERHENKQMLKDKEGGRYVDEKDLYLFIISGYKRP